jgi:hypothetical protein
VWRETKSGGSEQRWLERGADGDGDDIRWRNVPLRRRIEGERGEREREREREGKEEEEEEEEQMYMGEIDGNGKRETGE